MALHLVRPRCRLVSNPSIVHLFSTSSADPPPPNDEESSENSSQSSSSSHSSFSSYFSDVKASLKQKQQPQNERTPFCRSGTRPQDASSSSFPSNQSSGNVTSLEEIRKNLAGFRRRSIVPPPGDSNATPPSQSQQHISFQELYKRNVIAKSGDSAANAPDSGFQRGQMFSFEAVRESLRQVRSSSNAGNNKERKGPTPLSFSAFRDSLKMKPNDNVRSNVIGGTEALPISVFGKEMEEKKGEKGREGEKEAMKTEFVKMYSYPELGMKLGMLRPDGKKEEGWFSLQELNERLKKLREMEEKETESRIGGVPYRDLRAGLERLRMSDEEKKKKVSLQRLDVLGHLGGTPTFMLHPPKEHLVETYFHPNNMSSAEKMKIELSKVREEFKMSESDCGSARVQVAQLTTKIKHLSTVLHKKDKHSKKGLLAMVQKRKKLLKYLRRTDWDSYTLVLSKLGLRDNPDYKN